MSVDPLTKSYPMLTPYQFASNTPIVAIDLDGLESYTVTGDDGSQVDNSTVEEKHVATISASRTESSSTSSESTSVNNNIEALAWQHFERGKDKDNFWRFKHVSGDRVGWESYSSTKEVFSMAYRSGSQFEKIC